MPKRQNRISDSRCKKELNMIHKEYEELKNKFNALSMESQSDKIKLDKALMEVKSWTENSIFQNYDIDDIILGIEEIKKDLVIVKVPNIIASMELNEFLKEYLEKY